MDKQGGDASFQQQLDVQVKVVRRKVECWREAALCGESLLIWKRSWYAGALLLASTILFLGIWLWEPSILTAVSLIGLIVCLLDWGGGIFLETVFSQICREPWTASHEKRLDELCRSLVLHWIHARTALASLWLVRSVRPRVFYTVAGIFLLCLAWIGSLVHNLLLTYLVFTVVILTPGLRARGICLAYTSTLSNAVMQLLLHRKNE